MTDDEFIKTIPSLANKELLDKLDYCGYDSYYSKIREPVVAEIVRRLEENERLKCKTVDKELVINKILREKLEYAKTIIEELLSSCFGYNSKTVNYDVKAKAEEFLKGKK